MIIGRVRFELAGKEREAILSSTGGWSVLAEPDAGPGTARACEAIEDWLNSDPRLNLTRYSPADGVRGYLALARVAEQLHGKVHAPEPPPAQPGLVY